MRERMAVLKARTPVGQPLVMVTSYDALSARIADNAGVDFVLVGDSAATTVLGYANTRDVTMDEMLMLTRAARRGTTHALLVGDLPFGSYESNDAIALATARAFMDAGCDLIKLEGAGAMCARVRTLVAAGIPVVGHVGLLPQHASDSSQLRTQGKTALAATAIVRDALSLEQAGASLIVVEAVPSPVGAAIAKRVSVPVIGIGAGRDVDGQVLVYTDLLGLGDGHVPRFVRSYDNARERWVAAISAYAREVREGTFPSAAESYRMDAAELAEFERELKLDSP